MVGKVYIMIVGFLRKVLMLAESLLFIRLFLRFLGANPDALVVKYLYQVTDVLLAPVGNIFPNISWGDRLIDVVTLSAMAGYLVAFFILIGILRLALRHY